MKKKKNLLIQIAEPCQESWDRMMPRGLGRHCDSCNKTVMNFVGKSDADVVRLIQHEPQIFKGASVCGRFSSKQLNREIPVWEAEKSPDLLKWLAGLLLAGSAGQAFSQDIPDSTQIQTTESAQKPGYLETDSLKTNSNSLNDFLFYGKVVDKEDGKALSGVKLVLSGTDLSTLSDKKGYFSLVLPKELFSDTSSLPLIFTFYEKGFMVESVFRTQEELGKPEKIKLETYLKTTECFISGDIIVSGNFVPEFKQKKEIEITDLFGSNMENKQKKQANINPATQQLDHLGPKALLFPLLQAILPTRRRRRK